MRNHNQLTSMFHTVSRSFRWRSRKRFAAPRAFRVCSPQRSRGGPPRGPSTAAHPPHAPCRSTRAAPPPVACLSLFAPPLMPLSPPSSLQVCFFAAAREEGTRVSPPALRTARPPASPCAAGVAEAMLSVSPSLDVETFLSTLAAQFPGLEAMLPRCGVARNGEYVHGRSLSLSDGDEVAIIPPVSGG